MKKDSKSESSANLRQKAEAVYKQNLSKSGSTPPDIDQTLKLIHELEVHHIELEMQNDELRLAKDQITADAQKYADLYDFAPSGYFTLAKNGEIIELNFCGSRMLDNDRSFLISKMFGLYVSDDSKPVLNRFIDKVFSSKSQDTCEVVLQVNSNQPMYVNLSGTVSENGENCLIIAHDITERKLAEVALRESNEMFSAFMKHSPIYTFIKEVNPVESRVLKASENYRDMIGICGSEMAGKTMDELFPAEYAAKFTADDWKVVSNGEGVALDEDLNRRSYTSIKFPITLDGKTLLAGYTIDITERKRAEDALRESEKQYSSLFNNFLDSVAVHQIVLDDDGKPVDYIFIQANAAFEAQTGLHIADILGKRATEVIQGIEKSPFIDIYGNVALTGEPITFEQFLEPLNRYFHINAFQSGVGRFCTIFQDITERKLAEAELLKSEERYRSLLTNLEAGVVIHAPDTSIIMNNHRASELLGLSDDQMKGRLDIDPEWKFIDEKRIPLALDDYPVNQILTTKKPFGNIILGVILPATNSINWLTVNGFPVFDDQGEIAEVLISFIDVTERKKAEEALRKSKIQLEQSHQSAGAGTWDWDMLSQHLIWSKELYALFGLDPGSVGASFDLWNQVVHPDDLEVASKRIEQAIKEKMPLDSEYRVIYPNGEVHWINALGNTTYDDTGQPLYMAGLCTDITKRKLAEDALIKSESRLHRVYDSGMLGIFYWNANGQIIDANDKLLEIIGYSKDDLVNGKIDWMNMTPPEYRYLDENSISELMTSGVNKSPFEKEYIRKDGTRVPILISGAMLDKERFNGVAYVIDISERKQVEEALVQNRDLLTNLARLVPGVIYQYRLYPDGRSAFPYASPGMNDIYEVTPEEVQKDATPVFARLHPDDFDHVVDAIQESARTLNTFYCEYRVRMPRQGIRWRWSQAQPMRLEDGSILWHGIISDITARKLADEALLESERKFRHTVINLDEGYYSVTMDGVLLEHNQAFCRILGFDSNSDLKGVLLTDFWQNPDGRKEYLQALMTSGSISNYEIKVKSQTGDKKNVLVSCHLVKDKDEHPIRIEGVFLDITKRIWLEEALQRYTGRLQNLHKIDRAILSLVETPEEIIQKLLYHVRSLLSSQHASIGFFDLEKEILQLFSSNVKDKSMDVAIKYLISNAFGDLEILQKNGMDVVEDISTKFLPPDLQRILQSEGIMSCINVPLISGEKLVGVVNLGWAYPRSFTPEELEIASEVADEITIGIEQIRLRQAAKHYAEELEKRVEERTSQLLVANKELEAFSYSVSHDLRAPLRHINGYISILSKHLHDLPEKEKHYLDTIADSARQMGVLIDDLLNFSRTGRQEMQLTTLDMNVVLQDVMQVIKHESFGRGIKWKVAELPQVVGDYSLLRLVWLNLLNNAVKFSRVNVATLIEVGFVDENNEFVFFVRDNGVGFDMQYAHKLFGVFERLHSAQEFEGTGIGLANVRRIILRHNGRTWAEAEIDKGAVFYFSLPKG